jgi:hypothetical protein
MYCQSISKVDIDSKPATEPQKAEFTMKITGNGFGSDKTKVSVLVSPKGMLFQEPMVSDISEGGTVILVTFTAPGDFIPRTVIVQAGGSMSEPYVLAPKTSVLSDQQKYVKAYRSIIDPKDASDIFGKRIAKRFIVVQVTVTNRNKDYQYLIHDISLDFAELPAMRFAKRPEVSSIELSLLRGVAEKGQIWDRRNLVYRTLRGAGTVAAGLIGVTDFGSSYSPSVAVFNGPLLSGFNEALPDHTINEMNRLNDSAYSANSLVPKQQSKVMAIFLPMALFLTPKEAKKFWNDASSLPEGKDLRKLGIYVDGNFITSVEELIPSTTAAVIDPEEMKKFQNDKLEVHGYISGNYLSGTDVKLLNQDLPGVSFRIDGTPTDQRLNFIVTSDVPIAPGKTLRIGVVKKEMTKEVDVPVQYQTTTPTVTTVEPKELKQGDKDTILKLTGTSFLPGATQLLIAPPDGVTVGSIEVKNSKSLEAKISVDDKASTGKRLVSVKTFGQSSGTLEVTIVDKK